MQCVGPFPSDDRFPQHYPADLFDGSLKRLCGNVFTGCYCNRANYIECKTPPGKTPLWLAFHGDCHAYCNCPGGRNRVGVAVMQCRNAQVTDEDEWTDNDIDDCRMFGLDPFATSSAQLDVAKPSPTADAPQGSPAPAATHHREHQQCSATSCTHMAACGSTCQCLFDVVKSAGPWFALGACAAFSKVKRDAAPGQSPMCLCNGTYVHGDCCEAPHGIVAPSRVPPLRLADMVA
ncbi:MAG: hypothetical protein M1832_001379 [Thelocarpon impressellum]|nr:MAG: hypothetical protein M1832_001379 [Thelocarpon impressellum]